MSAHDPFTTGYLEAAIRDIRKSGLSLATVCASDLAPETLARIVEDCAAFPGSSQITGGDFWDNRQRGNFDAFPPLTAYLGDDGKVYLREAR